MKAIKFSDYWSAGGFIPAALQDVDVPIGGESKPLSNVLESVYGQAYIYLKDGDNISDEGNAFSLRAQLLMEQWEGVTERMKQLVRAQNNALNNNAVHEKVQQKRPPVGNGDFETAYTDGGTVRDISGGSFPASLYNDVQGWKVLYQPVLDLFRPLFHFAAPMSPECVEVWE